MLKSGRLKNFRRPVLYAPYARSHPKPSPNAAPFALQQHQRPAGGGCVHALQPDAVCGKFGSDFGMEELLLLSCADDDDFGQIVRLGGRLKQVGGSQLGRRLRLHCFDFAVAPDDGCGVGFAARFDCARPISGQA